MEASSNERPGMSPSCQDEKEGLGCWLCCRAVFIPRAFRPFLGRFIISPVFPAVSCSLHRQKWPPNSRYQAASWWPHSSFQTYQLLKGFCLSALCEEISLLKRKGIVIAKTIPIKMFNCKGGKLICTLNESPCLQHRRARNNLGGSWHFVSLRHRRCSWVYQSSRGSSGFWSNSKARPCFPYSSSDICWISDIKVCPVCSCHLSRCSALGSTGAVRLCWGAGGKGRLPQPWQQPPTSWLP